MPSEFKHAQIDFSTLKEIGENIGKAIKRRRFAKDVSAIPRAPNGEMNFGEMTRLLLQHDRPAEAASFARLGQSQSEQSASSDYQQQMLQLRRQEFEGRAGKPVTELGRLSSDERSGHNSPEIADARRNLLTTRQQRHPNIVEQIRQKLAAGQPLEQGEQRVYDDALRADPLMRLLGQGFGGGAQPQTEQMPAQAAPAPLCLDLQSAAPRSKGPLPFETNAQRRQVGQVYGLPHGRQALWTQDAQGRMGWELLN